MSFPFDPQKATDAASYFLAKGGGEMDKMKLTKLLYLADRESLRGRGVPMFGGSYFSLPHGPIPSEALDLMNQRFRGPEQETWSKIIGKEGVQRIFLLSGAPELDNLSPSEIGILERLHADHGDKTAGQLRKWCHDNVAEYEEVPIGVQKPITLKDVCIAVRLESDQVKTANQEAKVARFFRDVFAS